MYLVYSHTSVLLVYYAQPKHSANPIEGPRELGKVAHIVSILNVHSSVTILPDLSLKGQ